MNFERGKLVRFKGNKEKVVLISLKEIEFLKNYSSYMVKVFNVNNFYIGYYNIRFFEEIKGQK